MGRDRGARPSTTSSAERSIATVATGAATEAEIGRTPTAAATATIGTETRDGEGVEAEAEAVVEIDS